MENATSFGTQADIYAKARPHYPDALFDWIATQSPKCENVWDVGTGSGQAALSLSERFGSVYATDIDSAQINQAQIKQAPTHSNITYAVAPAYRSGLLDRSQDAVTVATALHWFDFERFWTEVARVTKPGGLFCAWTYHRAYAEPDIHLSLIDPVLEVLKPYWSEGNRISWRGYLDADVKCPFKRIETPEFTCALKWTPTQILGMMRSMSAHKKARLDGKDKDLEAIESKALKILGVTPRPYNLPIHVLAARITA